MYFLKNIRLHNEIFVSPILIQPHKSYFVKHDLSACTVLRVSALKRDNFKWAVAVMNFLTSHLSSCKIKELWTWTEGIDFLSVCIPVIWWTFFLYRTNAEPSCMWKHMWGPFLHTFYHAVTSTPSNSFLFTVLSTCNHICSTGCFLDEWRKAYHLLFLKPNKSGCSNSFPLLAVCLDF